MGYVDRICDIAHKGIRENVFAGVVIHIERKGVCLFSEAFGYAQTVPLRRAMSKDMLFDLASLTKVVGTLPAVMRSVSLGKIDLKREIAHYLPDWLKMPFGFAREHVTVEQLLTHTSGLPAWRPYYVQFVSTAQYRERIISEPLTYQPGTRVQYSDLSYMLLGFLLEEVWQESLDELCARLVFRPLEMQQTVYRPTCESSAVVCTECGNSFEKQMCQDYLLQCKNGSMIAGSYLIEQSHIDQVDWRISPACGQANDGNAFYGLQGVAGHAGLFSTISDVNRYLSVWRNEGVYYGEPFLGVDWVRLALSNHTATLNLARGYGFEVTPNKDSSQRSASCSAGTAASKGGFGHTGFTGTSLWVDPISDTQVIALSNRTHPQVRDGIMQWRQELYQAAFVME